MEQSIKQLRTSFTNNGKTCIVIKRNQYVALVGIKSDYTDLFTSVEVVRIYIERGYHRYGKDYPPTERITSNSQFGLDYSGSYPTLEQAEKEFDKVSLIIINKQL